jgi:Domain of unknown function (DUF4124)
MNLRTVGAAFAVAIALAAAQAGAQQVYKCQDAAGKVTYASNPCADLGMRSAGEVKESINVAPAQKVPPRPAESAPAPAAQSATPKPKAEKAAEPERRCFTVKTAKGVATRCNDKPEDADK